LGEENKILKKYFGIWLKHQIHAIFLKLKLTKTGGAAGASGIICQFDCRCYEGCGLNPVAGSHQIFAVSWVPSILILKPGPINFKKEMESRGEGKAET
jgi:hypothetical protein